MTGLIFGWLWFGVGVGMAADFHHNYKTKNTNPYHTFCVVLTMIVGPVFFPSIMAIALCKMASKEKQS